MPTFLRFDLTASPWIPDLLTHLWQSSVVAIAILLLLAATRRLSARTRCALGWIAVAKFVLPTSWLLARWTPAGGESPGWFGNESWRLPVEVVAAATLSVRPEPGWSGGAWLALLWAAGGIGFLAWWLGRARRALGQLLQNATVPSAALEEQVAAAARRVGLRTAPSCVVTGDAGGPALVGVRNPTLVLPRGLLDGLSEPELTAVLVHECVHMRRHDNLWSAMRAAFVALLWFNPVAWLLNRVLAVEMEKSCDERVLELTVDAEAYARGIVAAVRHALGAAPAGAAAAATPPVVARIEAILAYPGRAERAWLRWAAVATALAFAVLGGRAGAIAVQSPAPEAVDKTVSRAEAGDRRQLREASPAGTDAARAKEPALSIDFPDEDVRHVVRNVAELFQLNIVMPETLQGRTTIQLRDATWRQIFRTVLEPKGFRFVEEGNLVRIVKKLPASKVGRIFIVVPQGTNPPPEEIRASLGLASGDTFDDTTLDRVIRGLYATGRFKSVEVTPKPVNAATFDLMFVLKPNPVSGASSATSAESPAGSPGGAAELALVRDKMAAARARLEKSRAERSEMEQGARETLEKLAARIRPRGVVMVGGKTFLLVGDRRLEVGTHFTADLDGQDYEIELAAVDRTSFTLRYRGQEVTRPLKPGG